MYQVALAWPRRGGSKMRFAKAIRLGLMALAGGGCNPSNFDTVLDKAPVVAFDTGSAPVVLPLSSPSTGGTVAARMLVSRKDRAYLAIADFDKNGKVTLHQATDSDLGNL